MYWYVSLYHLGCLRSLTATSRYARRELVDHGGSSVEWRHMGHRRQRVSVPSLASLTNAPFKLKMYRRHGFKYLPIIGSYISDLFEGKVRNVLLSFVRYSV